MASVQLRDAIIGTAKVRYTRRPALYARQCDACKRAFQMRSPQGMTTGHVEGIFDRCAEDEDGRGLGNIFHADVCSFTCAQTIYDGGWKTIEDYAPYVKAGAALERVSLTIGAVLTESDLTREWEERGEQEPPAEYQSGRIYIGGSFSR